MGIENSLRASVVERAVSRWRREALDMLQDAVAGQLVTPETTVGEFIAILRLSGEEWKLDIEKGAKNA